MRREKRSRTRGFTPFFFCRSPVTFSPHCRKRGEARSSSLSLLLFFSRGSLFLSMAAVEWSGYLGITVALVVTRECL